MDQGHGRLYAGETLKFSQKVEMYRIQTINYRSRYGDDFGLFLIPVRTSNTPLRVIASSGDKESGVNWEHVSVSLPNRNPNWDEMCLVKRLFWDDEETVIQLHPPQSKWISKHPHCLHLWRNIDQEILLPPEMAV